MEEYIRVSGKTVEDAVLEASIQLGTSSDNIEWQVIEHETKGFLGLGAKKAVIEARRKTEEEDIISEIFSAPSAPAKKEKAPAKKAAAPEKKAEKKPEKKAEKKPEKKPEKKKAPAASEEPAQEAVFAETAAPVKAAPVKAAPQPVPETPVKADAAGEAAGTAAETVRVPADPDEARDRADAFLKELLRTMEIDAQISYAFEDGTLMINIEGDDMGLLIGKRGQTLDSIQYLTSLVVNKGKSSYVRVKLDTENYRERRRATLENLARNQAFKVKKTRRPVYLEPMNPYERRIIHSALQNDPYVTTHSEGEDPARKVVITLKKRERSEDFE